MFLTHELDIPKAAVFYAGKTGFRVIPVVANGKRPALKEWPKVASNDPAKVKEMFAHHTGNIGIACGNESGVLVIDVDLPSGPATLTRLQKELGDLPATLLQRTGSGGWQLLFKYPQGKIIKNSVGESGAGLGENVDVRGEGGMIVCPPSVHPSGNHYVWENDLPLAELPVAWIARLEQPQTKASKLSGDAGRLPPYIDAAITDELATVRNAPQGTRNNTLNRAAFSLGQWVGGGFLGYDQAQIMLLDTAIACGVLPDDGEAQTRKTIAGALGKGAQSPRALPAGTTHYSQKIEKDWPLSEETALPIPFSDRPVPLPNSSLLAKPLRDFVEHCAQALQVPLELPLFNSLAAMSVALQGKARVVINSGYCEPLALYLLVALPPGERKSPVVELCKRPLLDWERKQALLARETRQAKESERRSFEKLIESKRARLGSFKDRAQLQQAMEEIADLEIELPELPVIPRLFADDVTPEALAALLQKHNERLGIIEAEGGIFDILAGRYSNNIPNLDLLLKGWSGESVIVDRRRDMPIHLRSPLLTLCISPQPEVVQNLAGKPGFKGRGLLARFLYALPQSLVGYRKTDVPPVPESTKEQYAQLLRSILEMDVPTRKNGDTPIPIRLSAEAERLRQSFAVQIELAMREGAALEHMRDWAAKLPGQTVRLAGVLHCFAHPEAIHLPISEDTMRAAINLSTSLIEHAKAAFALMGADDNMVCARHILTWIRRTRSKFSPIFTGRECFQALRSSYTRMANINAGLEVLEERYYIFSIPPEPGKVGRHSQWYRVNPALFSAPT